MVSRLPVLQRKLLRDIWHLRGQILAISLVVSCGVATVVTTRTAYDSLVLSKDAYYAQYRFSDVFAQLKRAPETLRVRLESIPGVSLVETRVVEEVTLDVPGLAEPATGRLVSLPSRGEPRLNAVHLRTGRLPDPTRRDEVIASEAFAEANHLGIGTSIGAVLNGRWERLHIVGVGLSPEYVYEIRGTEVFPDNRRFGVLWMSRDALAPAFHMEGAFNDVALKLVPGAIEGEVIAQLDRLLEDYGGLGAYGRHDQISDRFLTDEIAQNRISGTVLPAIFLGVAAFLLNIVLSRLVAMQRDQIAVLKAFGYEDHTVGLHYLGFALIAVTAGALLGTGLGIWLGFLVNRLYVNFYRFPVFRYKPGIGVIAFAVGASAVAATGGALLAVYRALALPPAEAMRPEPPARFHAGWLEHLAIQRLRGVPSRMIARNLARRPLRAGLSVLGLALAVSILVVGRYFVDAVQELADVQFRIVQREDLTVMFHEPLPSRARYELSSLHGVLRSEPFRVVPARLRFEHRTRRVPLLGLEPGTELHQMVGSDLRRRPIPPEGVVLTGWLAQILDVRPGDALTVEVLEAKRPIRQVRVVDVVDERIGLNAYMDDRALARLMGERGSVSGAYLRVDSQAAPVLYDELKRMPAVAGVSSRLASLASFEQTLARSLGISTFVLVVFACTIACAVVYNAARITLSERGRELASLRVLGFSRGEVTRMLLGEQALLTLLAAPIGLVLGTEICVLVSSAYQWELFRLPGSVRPRTYAFALLVVTLAAFSSGWLVKRRLDRLDLVEVLKARE
jgi:putative ABC transport system permease protein